MMHPINNRNKDFIYSLPPNPERLNRANIQITPVQISIKTIDEIPIKQDESTTFQLRATLYDVQYKSFFGNTWKSSTLKIQPQKKLRIKLFNDLNLYFQTFIQTEAVIVVVELCYALDQLWLTVGWTVLRLFKHDGSLNTSHLRASLYYGTSQALYLMEEPFESNPLLQKIPGCIIHYSVHFHENMLKLVSDKSLIPEDIIFASSDVIPGLLYGKDQVDTFTVKKLESCTLNQISILLQPNVEQFEQQLCQDVIKEYYKLTNGNVSIIERRLKVGVHNGLCYVIEPHICQLIPDVTSRHGQKMSLQSHTQTPHNFHANKMLIHRNKVKLKKIPEDENMMIVFYVEYMLTISSMILKENEPSVVGSSRNITVIIGWNQWKPFNHASNKDSVRVRLLDGPSDNPNNNFVYVNDNENELMFTYLLSNKHKASGITDFEKHNSPSYQKSLDESSKMLEDRIVPVQPTVRSLPSLLQPSPRLRKQQHSLDSIINVHNVKHDKDDFSHHEKKAVDETDLTPRELKPKQTFHQTPSPVVANIPKIELKKQMFTKGILTKLHDLGFQTIVDQHNHPPEVVDASSTFLFDINKETSDVLKINEIVLQFTALSFYITSQRINYSTSSIILTFQFYHFEPYTSKKLMLFPLDSASNDKIALYILHRDNKMDSTSVGLQVRYVLDAAHMDFPQFNDFFAYLTEKPLHVDIWNGESRLHLGCCSLNLKSLCRQGKTSLQITSGYDIIRTNYSQAFSHVHSKKAIFLGQLYMQMANIGRIRRHEDFREEHSPRDVTLSSSLYDDPIRKIDTSHIKIKKARSMLEVHEHLAETLDNIIKSDSSSEHQLKERQRKLQRMKALRLKQQSNSSPDSRHSPSKKVTELQDKLQRLHIIQAYQERCKRQAILKALHQSVNTERRIVIAVGSVAFFEHTLRNPYNARMKVIINIEDPFLQVIIDTKEWLHFHNNPGLVKQKMISRDPSTGLPCVLLQPEETVFIPFKFLTYLCNSKSLSAIHQNMSHREQFLLCYEDSVKESKIIQVSFMSSEGATVSLLSLQVDLLTPLSNETFHFYHGENTFLKHQLRLASVTDLTGLGKNLQFIQCSDNYVSCDSNVSEDGDTIDIAFKVEVGEFGTRKKFYFMIYPDNFFIRPFFTWEITVDSLKTCDVSCIQGQKHVFVLSVRGQSVDHNIQCFSSNEELNIIPNDAFFLKANSVRELSCTLTSSEKGSRAMFINGIDVESGTVLYSWLINMICQSPMVTRIFQVQLPQQLTKQINKKIYYTNPYPEHRTFFLHTNVPEILFLPDTQLNLAPYKKQSIGLMFLPNNVTSVRSEILIFINNEKGGNEETISIQITN